LLSAFAGSPRFVYILLGIGIEGLLASQGAEIVRVALKLRLRRGLGIDFHITHRIAFHSFLLFALTSLRSGDLSF